MPHSLVLGPTHHESGDQELLHKRDHPLKVGRCRDDAILRRRLRCKPALWIINDASWRCQVKGHQIPVSNDQGAGKDDPPDYISPEPVEPARA
jgi:hypothetical protein